MVVLKIESLAYVVKWLFIIGRLCMNKKLLVLGLCLLGTVQAVCTFDPNDLRTWYAAENAELEQNQIIKNRQQMLGYLDAKESIMETYAEKLRALDSVLGFLATFKDLTNEEFEALTIEQFVSFKEQQALRTQLTQELRSLKAELATLRPTSTTAQL